MCCPNNEYLAPLERDRSFLGFQVYKHFVPLGLKTESFLLSEL
jgi:hypothetical protein